VGDGTRSLALSSAPSPAAGNRKPAEPDAQIEALQDDAKSPKEQQKTQLGELVLATGAGSLPPYPLAGILLTPVEQPCEEPEAVTR
jgi:hypothetical protein